MNFHEPSLAGSRERMNKILTHSKIFIGLALFVAFILLASFVSPAFSQSAATTITQGLDQTASGTFTGMSLPSFIGNLIRALLAAVGIVFLILMIYAGILYMTDQGKGESVKKAKSMMTSSVIGLIVIIGAYALTSFVIGALSPIHIEEVNPWTGG